MMLSWPSWLYPIAWREAREQHFAWKVRWRMRHDHNPLFCVLQDKVLVKDYARQRGVDSARLLHATQRPQDIPFEILPERYFIKANHGCGWNIACLDGQLYRYVHGTRFWRPDGTPVDLEALASLRISRRQAVAVCERWLRRRYRGAEWAYRCITPRILVEEALQQAGGGPFIDYRLYTVRGRVMMISVSGPLFFNSDLERLHFHADWTPFELTRNDLHGANRLFGRRPESLDVMLEAAGRLAADLDFVRVDMYETTRGALLGEMTVYPDGGKPGKPTADPAVNKWLGEQWILPTPTR